MVGYNCRCDPLWRKVEEIVVSGRLGILRQISITCYTNARVFWDSTRIPEDAQGMLDNAGPMKPFLEESIKPSNWRGDPDKMGGGVLVDVGTHVIDLMLWLAGAPPAEVSCFTESNGLPVETVVSLHARLANDMLFAFNHSDCIESSPLLFGGRATLTLTGDAGVLIATWGGLNPVGAQVWIEVSGDKEQITSDESFEGTAPVFVDVIRENASNPAPPEECAYPVALTEAAYRSAAEGRTVKLDIP